MGIPRLYTHLRPFARPETFPAGGSGSGVPTPLFIDGPGLAHHVYRLSCSSSSSSSSSALFSAPSYRELQAAIITYLDTLSASSLCIHKIYFDGHLPPSKRATRHSRLSTALSQLQSSHSHSHNNTAALPAAPFIVLATIQAVSSHARYSRNVSTVRGEAESFCARDAIRTRGVVLTGDSDLLLFGGAGWGVMMFRDVDVDVDAGGGGVSALVFRPGRVAEVVGVDLKTLGFQALQDPYVSFGVLRARAAAAAAAAADGAAWREFTASYILPGEHAEAGYSPRGIEPRIAEILQQQHEGSESVKTMFLPFLWEDPTRASAWDAGRRIRAAAYALLFPDTGVLVEEVCRRGQRIAAGAVQRVEDPAAVLCGLLRDAGDNWWVGVVLREITAVFEARGQEPPERGLLRGIAYMLCAPMGTAGAAEWTWERVQLYALAQAAWYSLLLVKEVVAATTTTPADGEVWRTLPGVAECIDGACFLAGMAVSGPAEKEAVERALGGKRPGSKRRKRKAKKRAAVAGRGPLEGNMFSALA